MDNDTYDDRIPRINDQINIKFIVMKERIDRNDEKIIKLAKLVEKQAEQYSALIKTLDEKVIPLIEGTHGKWTRKIHKICIAIL